MPFYPSITLQVEQTTVRMGETLRGTLTLTGGVDNEKIDTLTLDLRVKSHYLQEDRRVDVDESIVRLTVDSSFTIKKDETKRFPFEIQIPMTAPFSSLNTFFYLRTDLDVAHTSCDDYESVDIEVLPAGLTGNFMAGMELLGCQVRAEGFTGSQQLLHFRNTTWLKGKLDELDFKYYPLEADNRITGYFEIDKKTSGLFEKLMDRWDLDEKKGEFSFSKEQMATPEKAAGTVKDFVERIYASLKG